MGKLILCSGKIAKEPFFFRLTRTNVYSIEEVCYYIKKNIYMVQEDMFDKDFFHWMRRELEMDKTVDKLEKIKKEKHDFKDIVTTICCSCDYYTEKEIKEILHIIDETKNLPGYARKKYKGDNYLKCESYEKAIEEYEKIFESDEILQADEKIYGDLFHNMAVAYANIGEIHKAADLFLKAYEKNKSEESLAQCVYALRMCKNVEQYKKLMNELNIETEQKEKWEKSFLEVTYGAKASKQVKHMERLSVLVEKGEVEEYYEKVHGYISKWKNEYRRQISV